MVTILIIAVVLLIATGVSWIYRDMAMRAPLPIMTFALVLVLGFGVITHDRDQVADQQREAQFTAAAKAYDDCVARAERSAGNRSMWLAVGDRLALSGANDFATFVRLTLDVNLPALNASDCPLPPGVSAPTTTTTITGDSEP